MNKPSGIEDLSDDALLELRLSIDREIVRRGLTLNVGELGERLAVNYFNTTSGLPKLTNASRGAKNVDALSSDGERYSIKSVLTAKKTGTVYPDRENSDKQLFEHMLVVMLGSDFKLKAIYRFSWSAFLQARAWDRRMNAWYIPISTLKLALAEKIFSKE